MRTPLRITLLGAALALVLAPAEAGAADPAATKKQATQQKQQPRRTVQDSEAALDRLRGAGSASQSGTSQGEATSDGQSEAFDDARRRYLEEKERERARKQGTDRPTPAGPQDVRKSWAERDPTGGTQRMLPGQGLPGSQGEGQGETATPGSGTSKDAIRKRVEQDLGGGGSTITILDPRNPSLPEQNQGVGPSRSGWEELKGITRRNPTDLTTQGGPDSGLPSAAKGGKKQPGECDAGDVFCNAVRDYNLEVYGNACGADGCPQTPDPAFACGGTPGNVYCRCTTNCDANGYDDYSQHDEKTLPENAKKSFGGDKTEEQKKAEKAGSFLCSVLGIGCPAEPAQTEEAKKQEEERKKQEEARKQEEKKKQEEAKAEEDKKKSGSDPNCAIADSEDCYDYGDDPAWAWKQKQREDELRALNPKYTGSGDIDPLPEGAGERYVEGEAEWKHDTPVDPPDEPVAAGPPLPDCALAPGEGVVDPSDDAPGAPGTDFSHCEQELPSFDRGDLSHIFGGEDDSPSTKPGTETPPQHQPVTDQGTGGRN